MLAGTPLHTTSPPMAAALWLHWERNRPASHHDNAAPLHFRPCMRVAALAGPAAPRRHLPVSLPRRRGVYRLRFAATDRPRPRFVSTARRAGGDADHGNP